MDLRQLLAWYVEAGADEAIGAAAASRYVVRKEPTMAAAVTADPGIPAAAKPDLPRPEIGRAHV